MAVGHLQRIGVAHVDLLLARPPLALGVLDRDAGTLQAAADGAHHAFLLAGLEDVIVLDVGAGRLEPLIALGRRRLVGLVEQVELELGGAEGAHLLGREALHLALEHGARRMRHVVLVVVEHVAQHQRRAFEPGHLAQRGEVRLEDEIAVALVPARRRVARHRLHVDVVGQQVVAAVRLLVRAVDEILGLEALADQPPLHVDHRHQHRVDAAGLHRRLELVEPEIAGHRTPPIACRARASPTRSSCRGLSPATSPSSSAGGAAGGSRAGEGQSPSRG